MNSKEIFRKTLDLEKADRLPAASHWWGVYKYEVTGLDPEIEAWQEGKDLVPVYEAYFQKFKPDWFHLHIGTPRYFRNSIVEKQGNKAYQTQEIRSCLKSGSHCEDAASHMHLSFIPPEGF